MITVFISTAPSPSTAQTPFEIDLSAGATLPQDVQLYAEAVDSEDAGASFSFSWHLLRKPTGSSAAFDSSIIAEPTLLGVDVWGDYLLFCIATNTTSGATSQRDPLQAGRTAYTRVFVRSENLALVKPAPGERDWFDHAYEWVDALENLDTEVVDHETRISTLEAATPTTALADLTDVNLSILSAGESLVYDGAEWVNQVVSGGGSSTLAVDAGGDAGTVALATETLAFTGSGSGGVLVSGSSSAGEFSVDIALDSSLDVDISGTAQSALLATQAQYANYFVTPNTLSLTGPITGSAQIGTSTYAVSLFTTIGAGQVTNTNLQHNSINFANSGGSSAVELGGTLSIEGTPDEVEVSQAAGTFTIGLPASINANAATATALQTARTFSLSSGATGLVAFNGTGNANIVTTLATPTNFLRGGVLYDQITAFGNTSGKILNRERVVLNSFVDNTHYENATASNHATDHDGIDEQSSAAANLILHAVSIFRNPFKTLCHIDSISAIIGDSGVEGGDGYYELELVIFANIAAVRSNTYTATGTTLTLTSSGDHGAGADYLDFSEELTGSYVASGAYFGFRVNNSPKYLGHALHIQVNASREIGIGSY